MDAPKTLQQAIQFFSDYENCRRFMIAVRWEDGTVRCPICGSEKVTYLENARVYRCYGKHPRQKFSLKVGTVFEDSPIGLDKWLPAVWLLTNCRNGVSSYEISRSIGVTQKSAWFMLHRIREAMRTNSFAKISGDGPIEVDETFVGGNIKNMHKERKVRYQQKRGTFGKAIVMGLLDRDTRQVRAKVIPNVKRETLQNEILNEVSSNSTVYTDSAVGYDDLAFKGFVHETVNHLQEYVKGEVHTQGIENFWSLLKRSLRGTYVAVEPFHLDRYVTEQMFRFNNRKGLNDYDRFAQAVSQIAGKRLTYAEVTGKVGETSTN
jgi:transposase-like protein